ncbi:pyridoxal-phosphate dependent enzyme [Salinibacillus xinjiangensis]|uniref:threonine ammonia-lyase n=1 Tax=Salinibacillus xinjiangensis TaxID=1229268 RepID=A0A6G1X5Y5_9BACI|nr:pyridoxal-phosphate dependent enzyme [Salinibacillus xinjiangensis]MRG86339.1 pyridoxal-phosphate dependent enzyme [Salinibacillus xinjiangensis]
MNTIDSIVPRQIWEAKQRIASFVKKTPLIQSKELSKLTNKNIYLKLETVNEVGAFKLRGAANKILSLSKLEREKGVTTFSTGNHGLAVAYVANQLGIPAVICVSNRVPEAKIDTLQKLGAELNVVGESQDDAANHCKHLEQEYGMAIVPPFDDTDIIAGQGTIGLELFEDLPSIDQCVIPLSGGGLLSGIGIALKSVDPAIRVSGVSIEGASAMSESLKKGYPVDVPEKETLADSLLGGIGANNQYTLHLVKHLMDDLTLLSEDTIEEAMIYLLAEERLIVEGAAAVGVGAILEQKLQGLGNDVVLIISGNNGSISALKESKFRGLEQKKGACM